MIDFSTLRIDRPRFHPGSPTAYLVAALIAAAATGLRLVLVPGSADFPYVPAYPAVIAATFLCGAGAGVLTALLSGLLAWFLILPAEISQLSIFQSAGFVIGSLTVTALVGLMRAAGADIRRKNEALLVSEGKFRGLIDSAPDAMVIVDAQRRIVLVNARTEDLFGSPRDALLGHAIETLLSEPSRSHYQARLAAFMSEPADAPRSPNIDLRGLRKDGSEFPIEMSLGALRAETGLLVSHAIRDMTERRRIELRLEEASKAKSDFLANVSHELRTPLNAIIGFSEMIRDAVLGPVDARYREYGSYITESGRHLQKIINDILDISKIEGGRLMLREEIVSIGESVGACRRIVVAMANAAEVTLAVSLPRALPPLRLDPMRFQQILLNLMSNAVKFTPAGGRVTVTAGMERDGAVIAVEDTGVGMKAEDIATALEPFGQIEGPLTRRFDGTGLGLPLAKALVELHGGRLEIASAPGEGTTVRIRLPPERIVHAAA